MIAAPPRQAFGVASLSIPEPHPAWVSRTPALLQWFALHSASANKYSPVKTPLAALVAALYVPAERHTCSSCFSWRVMKPAYLMSISAASCSAAVRGAPEPCASSRLQQHTSFQPASSARSAHRIRAFAIPSHRGLHTDMVSIYRGNDKNISCATRSPSLGTQSCYSFHTETPIGCPCRASTAVNAADRAAEICPTACHCKPLQTLRSVDQQAPHL